MEPALCFESRNTSCLRTIYPLSVRVSLYLFLGVMVVLTVCGNLLVVMSVAQFKQLHTPTNYLILSLAVSDLLLGLLVMVPSMIQSVETCWYFGDVFCKVWNSTDVLLCTASILNLSFISIDRYYAVCQPLLYRSKITVNAVLIMILVTWSVSAVVGFGMIFLKLNILGIEEFYYDHVACDGGCVLFQSGVSSTVSSAFSFYIPGVVMLGIYLKIFLVAQRQVRSIHNTRTSDPSQTKATKTLAIIMGAFLSFWTPFFVCNIIDPFISYSTPPALFGTLAWVAYLNSTVNPLVYAFFYSWFRKAFRVIISGKIFNSDISDIKLFTE
ncbi:trace amine-associated receptor 1-like [Centroberyx affinis]|uniref:trace amine-associated receptor 1-like n=1 Tax=Centroberyx affinis TaxID=166261 RepID=UPI003A5BE1B7